MRSAATAPTPAATPDRAAPQIRMFAESAREETLLRVDLSDLVLPKVNNLHVDGLQRSWLSRLFGKH